MGWILLGVLIGALLGGGLGALMAVSDESDVLIVSDYPITEDEVRQKLQSKGWINVATTRDSRYIEAIASKNGGIGRLTIDSVTGKIIVDDRDED